jgi:plastocyanin
MRATVLAGAAFVLFLAACSDDPSGTGNDVTIEMRDNLFSPASRTITAGTRVRWSNTGAVVHNTTSSTAGLWASGNVNPGGQFTRDFNTAGTFQYTCTLHPGMAGTIIVQ